MVYGHTVSVVTVVRVRFPRWQVAAEHLDEMQQLEADHQHEIKRLGHRLEECRQRLDECQQRLEECQVMAMLFRASRSAGSR